MELALDVFQQKVCSWVPLWQIGYTGPAIPVLQLCFPLDYTVQLSNVIQHSLIVGLISAGLGFLLDLDLRGDLLGEGI